MTSINKKRIRISSPASDSDNVDQRNPKTHEDGNNGDCCREKRLNFNTCYVCDVKDNWVLLCHGEECPIAIHQSCNSDEPDFDEFGNFYCPYCWYKRVIVKSLKLKEKLMVIDKSSKGRETFELGFEVSKDNVVEVTSVNPSGNRMEGDEESYEKFVAMEKNQRMKEVAGESYSREVSETGADDVDEGRKQQTRCDINQEAAYSFEVGVKTSKQRIYSDKNQRIKRVVRIHKRGVFINDEGTQGWCHENKQQEKAGSTESCAQEVPRTDIKVSRGFELREGGHIKKNRHYKTVETEIWDKEVSTERERMRERAVERDGDESYLAENQYRRCQDDMRNDNATFTKQENGFRIERNHVSSSISSPMSVDNKNDSNAASRELAMIIHPMAGLQNRPTEAQPIDARPIDVWPYCSVSSKKPSFLPEKYGHKSHLEKNGAASNDPGQRRFVLCNDRKRKRLFWTTSEEEMLRVGVEKFPGVRNIPWRKILEFGRDVFNRERVPTDLKDKWKNMNKMAFDDGKWVSLSTERQPNH